MYKSTYSIFLAIIISATQIVLLRNLLFLPEFSKLLYSSTLNYGHNFNFWSSALVLLSLYRLSTQKEYLTVFLNGDFNWFLKIEKVFQYSGIFESILPRYAVQTKQWFNYSCTDTNQKVFQSYFNSNIEFQRPSSNSVNLVVDRKYQMKKSFVLKC